MSSKMRRVGALARIVVVDGMRSHAVLGLLVLTLACEAAGLFFFEFIPRDIGRASNDFIFSISFAAGLVFLFFHAVQVAAWGGDKRLIYTLMARPFSRAEYVLGLFFGLSILLMVLNSLLAGVGYVVLQAIKNQVAVGYFSHFSPAYYALSWIGLCLTELSLLSVILLLSAAVRGAFTVLLLTLSYYLICSGLPVVRELVLQRANKGSEGMSVFLTGLAAVFPDFSRLDIKQLVVATEPPPLIDVMGPLGVIGFYVVLGLFLGCMMYERKDLR